MRAIQTGNSTNPITTNQLVVARARATHRKPLDIRAQRGDLIVLVGANGAGKTSILKALAGLEPAASGNIRTDGRVLLVPQHGPLFRTLTVREHLMLRHQWLDTDRFAIEIAHLIGAVDLSRRAGNFSGGEQRLIALALALACDANVILLDEPLAQLHPDRATVVVARLDAARQHGSCVVMSEHRFEYPARVDYLIDLDPPPTNHLAKRV